MFFSSLYHVELHGHCRQQAWRRARPPHLQLGVLAGPRLRLWLCVAVSLLPSHSGSNLTPSFSISGAAFCALFEKTFHVMFTSPRLAKVVQAALTQPRQWFVNARQPSYLFQPKGRAKQMLVIRPKSEPFDSVQTGSGLGLYQLCAALGAVAMIDNVDEGYLALGSFFIPLGWLALELTRTFKGTLYLPAPYGPIPGMLFGLFYAFFGVRPLSLRRPLLPHTDVPFRRVSGAGVATTAGGRNPSRRKARPGSRSSRPRRRPLRS